MTGNIQRITKHLFQSPSLIPLTIEQLEACREKYPFFGIGHFLISKKLYDQHEEGSFLPAAQKTALYFSNPYWLQWLLENTGEKNTPDIWSSEPPAIAEKELQQQEFSLPDLKQTFASPEKTSLTANEGLIFEPYHTVDYFASQGIKFIEEENPQDKFGKQLKSFTEWLKTMKKLPQKGPDGKIETVDQAVIEGFAAHSIEEKEILTETMADVLVKQGKYEAAIHLYQKLSLQNPSKSAYFAAKIEQLNPH